MKVNITKESKQWMTVAEHEKAKCIVKDMRENEQTAAQAAQSAVEGILWSEAYGHGDDRFVKVHEASAEVCRDYATPLDYFGEDCGRLNVWIKATVETAKGFFKIGCLLSDIWMLDASDESKNELIRHGWIRYYAEQK